MSHEPGSIIRPDPVALFLTWTTYGSWLPGDSRGWVDRRGGVQVANRFVEQAARRQMVMRPITLTSLQRGVVARSIAAHCRFRGWTLHACQCRTQHVHVVLTAVDSSASTAMSELKAWGTRALDTHEERRSVSKSWRWWAKGGSGRLLFDQRSLEDVAIYVRDCQERPRQNV